ncbi:hypothetical protein BH10ACT8_BH10ACT8_18140 [soil metagenome]
MIVARINGITVQVDETSLTAEHSAWLEANVTELLPGERARITEAAKAGDVNAAYWLARLIDSPHGLPLVGGGVLARDHIAGQVLNSRDDADSWWQ